MSPILHEQDDIVRDSIIKNKDRTKSYWEQLMTAAAENNRNYIKPPHNVSASSSIHSNRNSVSSLDDSSLIEDDTLNVKEEKRRIERELRLQHIDKDDNMHVRMEEKIARELQEMRQREEELRIWRQQQFLVVQKTEDTINKIEEVTSQDGSNYSEYGSDEKEPSLDGSTRDIHSNDLQRTQSLDSVSSGHSSGSGIGSGGGSSGTPYADIVRESIPKRRSHIIVRPYEEPEDNPVTDLFSRTEKETPIEREIRAVAEREAELKRQKSVDGSTVSEEKTSLPKGKKMLLGKSKDAVENDTRHVQKRLATNRIQQEIEEASEREIELRTEGKILTTSQETVDAKVTRFTQLAEHAIQEQKTLGRRMKRSTSTTMLADEDPMQMAPVAQPRRSSTYDQRKPTFTTPKGIMERFIASKGRMSVGTTVPSNSTMRRSAFGGSTSSILAKSVDYEPVTPAPVVFSTPPTRNGYRSAEEKIQSELEEMRKREEEYRLQRAHTLAQSQPNLLSMIETNTEDELDSWKSHEETENRRQESNLSHAMSNPNFLDTGIEKMGRRKRFSLLEQWENRIQNNTD